MTFLVNIFDTNIFSRHVRDGFNKCLCDFLLCRGKVLGMDSNEMN